MKCIISSKTFYERFNGKKVISDEALAYPDIKVEELYNEKYGR